MKILKTALILLTAVIYFSCDDSGVTTNQNTGTLSVNRLQHIDKSTVGTYELWGSIETSADHDENSFRSMGRFDINSSGAITDTAGNPFTPNLGKFTNINSVGDILITIQPPGYTDTIPSDIKLLGGAKQLQGNELVYDLTMGYSEILPASLQIPSASCEFLLASPTTGIASSEYKRGLWFTKDTSGNTAGLTLPVLPDSAEWTYQAWVIDNTINSNIYNIGRFESPSLKDNNQQCELSGGLIWNLPGNDWLQANCPGGGKPDITDLNNNYKILITLEPKFEQGAALNVPFYLTIFSGSISDVPFGTLQNAANSFSSVVPSAQVRLSSN